MNFRRLVSENSSFRMLLCSQAASEIGNWFNTIALMGLVYSKTESGMMIGLVLVASALPALLMSPFSGVLADRWDKKSIMIWTDLARAALVLALMFAPDRLWIVFPVKILISVASGLFTPARQATIPRIVGPSSLMTANSASSMLWGLMGAIGASLGGIAASTIGYEAAFAVDALSFVVSALFLRGVEIKRSVPFQPERPEFKREIAEGYRYVRSNSLLAALILVGISWGIVGGAFYVLIPIFGAGVFKSGDFGIGLLYSIDGLGVLAGGLCVHALAGRDPRRMKLVFGWAYLLQGLLFAIFAISTSLSTGVAVLFAMRFCGGLIIPLDTTLIQKFTPPDLQGRVFSLHAASYGFCMQISMLISGCLLESFSARTVGLFFSFLCFFVSIGWLLRLYSGQLEAPAPGWPQRNFASGTRPPTQNLLD